MILRKPDGASQATTLIEKALQSKDFEVRYRAVQYVVDELAERIETQEQLEVVLEAIPDPEQRYMVLDRLTPMLKFKPEIQEIEA